MIVLLELPPAMSASASDYAASKAVSPKAASSPINRHPPKARLAFRVGITGHRPERLSPADVTALAEPVRFVLETVANVVAEVSKTHPTLYSPDIPVLRVISPIAEGADRIVAEEGLRLGWQLECPLPFPIDGYEKDFQDGESKSAFRRLLAHATSTLELDGSRSHAAEAYAAAGRMVLAQCDVLIAIWDGEEQHGRGGTAEIIEAALAHHIPVVWIKAHAPHNCWLLRASRGGSAESWWEAGDFNEVIERIRQIVLPPQPEHHRGDLRERYFAETQPGKSVALWELFRNLLADFRIQNCLVEVDNFESATVAEWERELDKVPADLKIPPETARAWKSEWAQAPALLDSTKKHLAEGFLEHSAWSDKLADYYAKLHRSAFVLNYGLGVLAVFFAVLAFCCWPYPWTSKGLVCAELVTLIVIVAWWAVAAGSSGMTVGSIIACWRSCCACSAFSRHLVDRRHCLGQFRTSLTVIRGTPGFTGTSRPSYAPPACRRRKLMQRTYAPIGGLSGRSWLSINGSTTRRASNGVYLDYFAESTC